MLNQLFNPKKKIQYQKKIEKKTVVPKTITTPSKEIEPKQELDLTTPVNEEARKKYEIKKEARNIIKELYDGIDYEHAKRSDLYRYKNLFSNSATKNALAEITPENVAFVYVEYENKSGRNLTEDINNEIGLDINHIKNYICKNLVARAESLKLDGVSSDDYQRINDVNELHNWIMDSIKKLDIATAEIVEVKNGENFKELGIDSISIYKKESSSKAVYYYTNGKIVEEITDGKQGVVRMLRKAETQSQQVMHNPASQPQKILPTINIPAKSIKIEFDATNNNAKEAAKALEENKTQLMELLDIDNETYNNYAKLTMAILERETGFGEYCLGYNKKTQSFTKDYKKYKFQKMNTGDYAIGRNLEPVVLEKYMSFGMSGIKYDELVESSKTDDREGRIYKRVLSNFATYGINGPKDLYNPQKCAIATIIYAKLRGDILKEIVNKEHYEKLVKGEKTTKLYDLESKIQACPSESINEYDVIANTWNRGFSYVKDGTMNPNEWEYNNTIRENMQKYNIVSE